MAQDANKREVYSSIVDAKLRANSVFAGIFNQRHDGSAAAGAVKIPVRAEATAVMSPFLQLSATMVQRGM